MLDSISKCKVSVLPSSEAMALVLQYHYSRRKVGAKYSFGLFCESDLVGCVLYSVPASYTLCKGVCGEDFKGKVLELSRLVVTTKLKNAASYLIGNSLKKIGNKVVVSYADCNSHVGHVGYVYQATNWIYTGQGTSEPQWIHPVDGSVVSYTRRHIDKKAEALGMHWRDLKKKPQLGKHRYVTFSGDARFKKLARKALRYREVPFPKGPTIRHEESES